MKKFSILLLSVIALVSCVHEFPEAVDAEVKLSLRYDTELPIYQIVDWVTKSSSDPADYDVRYVIKAFPEGRRGDFSTTAAKTTALKNGAALVIYETTVAENMAWGRCDAGWVYLYYVDLTPVVNGAVDARVVYNDNTIIYSDVNCSAVAGTYAKQAVVDIYEVVGKMARTELGWISTDNLL